MADNKLVQLAVDLYEGKVTEFSKDDMNSTLRQAFVDICGTEKPDYKTMRKHGVEVFEIMEEAIGLIVERKMEEEFGRFAEYRNVNWGDQKQFILDNPDLFDVAVVADGTGNLLRQRIDNGSLLVDTYMRGIKIYEEFYRFLAGRVDWSKTVNKVADSYMNHIYTLVYKAMYDSYSALSSTYAVTGSFSATVLDEMIDHVEAANNTTAIVIGTRNALSKVIGSQVSDTMKDDINARGHLSIYNGRVLMPIRQVHTPGSDTFAINNSFLAVIPTGEERIVKIVEEGDSIIKEVNGGENKDHSLEYEFLRKSGISVVTAAKYGLYRLS